VTMNSVEPTKNARIPIFAGAKGFITLTATVHDNVSGALVGIKNPNNKVNTLPPELWAELGQALDFIESDKKIRFVVFHGTADRIHAGADVNLFSGGLLANENPPDYECVHDYIDAGANIDIQIKKIGKEIPTVSIFQGERFGGSVEWPLMAEFCVAANDTGISLSEPTIGLVPGWSGILNILLKSGIQNALFIGAASARLTAAQMLDLGIADCLCTPDAAMENALRLATIPKQRNRPPKAVKRLATEDELFAALSPRLDPKRYQRLRDEASRKKDIPDPKEFNKWIDKRLSDLGKPLAPLAVEAIFGLIAKHGAGLTLDNLDRVFAMALDEADACNYLMKTYDRVSGIDSVLKARENPLKKIPVYQRK